MSKLTNTVVVLIVLVMYGVAMNCYGYEYKYNPDRYPSIHLGYGRAAGDTDTTTATVIKQTTDIVQKTILLRLKFPISHFITLHFGYSISGARAKTPHTSLSYEVSQTNTSNDTYLGVTYYFK